MTQRFPARSEIRRVALEPAVGLGAGRALLLQLANPAVAAGVSDHSEFEKNPFARLQGTLEAVAGITFGSRELGDRIGRRVRWVHDFVVGPGYTANDPTHLLWVHGTLLDTMVRFHERFVGPVRHDELYEQMGEVAEVFGCPRSAQPATWRAFRDWFDTTVGEMAVSDVGRDLSRFILAPTLPYRIDVPLTPVLRLERTLSLGSMPPTLRDQLDVSWTAADHVRFERTTRRLRRVLRATPRAVRTAPSRANNVQLLWMAERRVREWEARHGQTVVKVPVAKATT